MLRQSKEGPGQEEGGARKRAALFGDPGGSRGAGDLYLDENNRRNGSDLSYSVEMDDLQMV